jgi:hypothetical protein
MDLTLAEQLLLIQLDDEKGGDTSQWGGDPGLAGALLLDLARAGDLEVGEGGDLRVGAQPPSRAVLADAHRAIAEGKPRDAKGWVSRLQKDLKPIKERVADDLVAQGVLDERRRKLLGFFPQTRFPQRDPEPERALRARLREVLVTGREPTEEEAMLVALMLPFGLVEKAVEKPERKEAKRRAEAIADGGLAGKAVADTVKDVQTAVMVATMASITAATTSAATGS